MASKKILEGENKDIVVLKNDSSYSIKIYDNLFDFEKEIWDSKLLGINFYRINDLKINNSETIDKFFEFLKLNFEIDCLSYKTELTNLKLIQNLMKSEFKLVGFPVKLSISLKNIIDKKDRNIRPFQKNDLDYLLEMSTNSFLHAYRYHDENLDKNKVDELYRDWIRNSCNGRANVVLVYQEDNIPKGFIACNVKNDRGLIDLIAVSKDSRGKGIGKKLVLNSLMWFKGRVNNVEVNTELTNYPSLRMYQSNGFNIEWSGVNLNYWFKR